MRIAQISDLHFGGENRAALEGCADWLAANPYDLLVVSGDITLGGAKPEFAAAIPWLEGLKGPKIFTPGNHDTPYHSLPHRIFSPWARYRRAFGEVDGAVMAQGDWRAVSINTARGVQIRTNWSKGEITQGQVDRALARLAPAPLRLVACHHPLIEMLGAPVTGAVRGGEAAARRMAEHGVDLVMTGHVHVPFALAYAYGDGKTYAVGSGTMSVRERGCPAGFNIIDVKPDEFLVTAMGWTGSHFEAWRTWSLPRRSPSPTEQVSHERDQEQDNKHIEKQLGDADGRSSQAAKAEDGGQ